MSSPKRQFWGCYFPLRWYHFPDTCLDLFLAHLAKRPSELLPSLGVPRLPSVNLKKIFLSETTEPIINANNMNPYKKSYIILMNISTMLKDVFQFFKGYPINNNITNYCSSMVKSSHCHWYLLLQKLISNPG
jgi:hypothetical protein